MLAGLSGAVTLSATAHAEPSAEELKRARDQFREAISLQTGGNWAGALTLFRDVSQVRNTPQVRFNIAICEENLGKLLQALGDYKLAAEQARQEGAESIATEVEGHLAALEARIPKLVVTRGANAQRAKILVDGVELGSKMLGQELPLDAGSHVVEAQARGFRPFEKSFDVDESGKVSVEVALEAGPEAAGAGVAGSGAAASGSAQVDGGDLGARGAGGVSLLPYIVGGAGVLSLGTSGVFFAMRSSAINDLNAACPTHKDCDPSLKSTADKGQTYNIIGDVTLGLGVVGVALGSVLLFTSQPSEGGHAAIATLRLGAGAPGAPMGARLLGQF